MKTHPAFFPRSGCLRALMLVVLALSAAAVNAQTLAAPVVIEASDGSYADKVTISWTAVARATRYRVFRNTIPDANAATDLGTTVSWVFADTAAVPGQTYFYWVRAESANGAGALSAVDQGRVALSNRGPGGGGRGPGPLDPPPAPAGNAVTASKVALGKVLFWDEQLSSTNTMACATCHAPEKGGSDLRAKLGSARAQSPGPDGVVGTADDVTGSPGVVALTIDGIYQWDAERGYGEQVTGRYPRSVTDAAYAPELFWDGRASTVFTDPVSGAVALAAGAALESQSVGPPMNSAEMAHSGRNWTDAVVKLKTAWPLALAADVSNALTAWIDGRTYPELFDDAFGSSEITVVRLAEAIASYERTLYSDRTAFDADAAGISLLTGAAAAGRNVFTASNCNVCHTGALHTDDRYHNIGLRPVNAAEDSGRFVVTGNEGDRGRFRTPALRNASLRGPFMHNGSLATLADVVDFYDRGGDFNGPNKDNNVRPLGLSAQEKSNLVAYLETLTDARVAAAEFPFDHPTLATGSNRAPQVVGSGQAGSGGVVPQAVAIEPAQRGSRVTLAVSGAAAGADAVLVIAEGVPPADRIPSVGESTARVAMTLAGSSAVDGHGAYAWQVPDAMPVGGHFYGRWYVGDAGANGGIASSAVIDLTVLGERDPMAGASDTQLTNLSARAITGGDAGPAISGFTIGGTGNKTLIVRAVGPTLGELGVAGALTDPAFSLVRDGVTVAGNDNWTAADAARFSAVGAFALPAGSKDAAAVVTLPAGNATAPVVSADGGSGVALLELYDADNGDSSAALNGVSTRAFVGTGDDRLVVGFVVAGSGTARFLVRAVGPTLTDFEVDGALADPQLTLYRNGEVLLANDDWGAQSTAQDVAAAAATVGDFALAAGSRDAAMVVELPAGVYSAVVTGANATQGTGLVEIYLVP